MGLLGPYRAVATGAFLSLVLVSATSLIGPWLLEYTIDSGIRGRDARALGLAAAGLVGAAAVRGGFGFLQGYWGEVVSQGVAYDLRNAVYAKLQRLSFSYHDRAQTGQLLARVTSDVEVVRQFVGTGFLQLASAITLLVGSAIVLFALEWRLALAALGVVPVIGLVVARFVSRVRPGFQRAQEVLAELNVVLQENIAGVRIVRGYAAEPREAERYAEVNDRLLGEWLRLIRTFATTFPLIFFLANLGTLAVFWYGGRLVVAGDLSLGRLVAFNGYLALLLLPLFILGGLGAMLSRASASAGRIFEVVDAPLEVTDRPGAHRLGGRGRAPVLRGRALPLSRCGNGGAEGGRPSMRCPERPSRSWDAPAAARARSSTSCPASTTSAPAASPSTGTTCATCGSTPCALWSAWSCRRACSSPARCARTSPTAARMPTPRRSRPPPARRRPTTSSRSCPEGYETHVGERGVGLSGGQRQRLAIARAILVDPRILILDDATSAVDAHTERRIQAALDRLLEGRTALVIAQRIATVRRADRIILLEEGVVAASGSHDRLLAESALYGEIVASQLVDDRPALHDTQARDAS